MSGAQVITEELRAWIVAQVQSGHGPQAVLDAMKASGWSEDTAIQALETTLERFIAERGLTVPGLSVPAAAALPSAVPVPEPDLDHSPLFVDTPDRRVAVLAQMRKPRLVVWGDLVSRDECEALMEAARPRLSRSLTVSTGTGGEEAHEDRTSEGMFFDRGEIEVVRRIEDRLAALLNWPVDRGEGLQVLRYRPGAEYKPHFDYFEPGEPGTPTLLARGGQRVATVVIYLNNPEAGGATTFPDAGLEVGPRQGNAVFFSYGRPHASTGTLHGGAPVVRGEKWIATKWLRERRFG